MIKFGVKPVVFLSMIFTAGVVLLLQRAEAAGYTLRLENDSNSRIEVKNAIVRDDETTILFWTWPGLGDPNVRKDCAMNYYTVTLRPGLANVKPQLMTKDACAGRLILFGGLLEDRNGKFIIRNRLELWRDNKQISSESFSSMHHTKALGVDSKEINSQFAGLSPTGDVVMAIMVNSYSSSERPGTSWVVTSLRPNNDKRWLRHYDEGFSIENLWTGHNGSALLHVSEVDRTSTVPALVPKLLIISETDKESTIQLIKVPEAVDLTAIRPGSMEDFQKIIQQQKDNPPEELRKLSARSRPGGGFDVLYERESPEQNRNGFFLLRLAPDGSMQTEIDLQTTINDHGLDRWFDFYVHDGQLFLLSNYPVTQSGVNSKRKVWQQTIVGQLDLSSGRAVSRLIPLDHQYLEAAMNAGDEGQQYLEGKPGGEPILLTTLGGSPLSVSRGWLKKRGTLRLYEVTEDLVTFTEAYDNNQARLAREQTSRQKKTDRQARQQQMNEEMKEATGLSQDEFESLSDEEKAMHMMKEGNMEAMMAAVMKQAQSAQAGMTPEQAAQMQASMAQIQAMSQGSGMALPSPAPAVKDSSEVSATSFTVDALMRGHIKFDGRNGKPVILTLLDRQNGNELFNREFADGVIDEYISLGRYKLPAEQIGAVIKRSDGQVLENIKAQIK